jgi:hypothetical protein
MGWGKTPNSTGVEPCVHSSPVQGKHAQTNNLPLYLQARACRSDDEYSRTQPQHDYDQGRQHNPNTIMTSPPALNLQQLQQHRPTKASAIATPSFNLPNPHPPHRYITAPDIAYA